MPMSSTGVHWGAQSCASLKEGPPGGLSWQRVPAAEKPREGLALAVLDSPGGGGGQGAPQGGWGCGRQEEASRHGQGPPGLATPSPARLSPAPPYPERARPSGTASLSSSAVLSVPVTQPQRKMASRKPSVKETSRDLRRITNRIRTSRDVSRELKPERKKNHRLENAQSAVQTRKRISILDPDALAFQLRDMHPIMPGRMCRNEASWS